MVGGAVRCSGFFFFDNQPVTPKQCRAMEINDESLGAESAITTAEIHL